MGLAFKKLSCWVGKLGAFHEATLQSLQRSFSNAARATDGLFKPQPCSKGAAPVFSLAAVLGIRPKVGTAKTQEEKPSR